MQERHVCAGALAARARGRHRLGCGGGDDDDVAPRLACEGAARRHGISGSDRLHQRARPHDGRRRRLRLALAVRERGALGESDQDRLIHADAKRLWHHHAIGAALRAPSRWDSQHRPGAAPARDPRHGGPTDEVFARRSQALPHGFAHLLHGVLRHHGQRADAGQSAHGATHARPGVDLGMDRRSPLDSAQADRAQARSGLGARGGRGCRGDDPQRADRQMPFGCARCIRTERRSNAARTGLSDAPVPSGMGRQHLDQVAAAPRGQRQAVLHARGDLQVQRPHHQDRQGAHLHLHHGSKVGDHLPVGRDAAARRRLL